MNAFTSQKERNKKENDVQDNAGTQITVNDSVNLRSPSPDVDGVFDSKCTSSNLRDGQPDCSGSDCLQQTFHDGMPGRGLSSIDDVLITKKRLPMFFGSRDNISLKPETGTRRLFIMFINRCKKIGSSRSIVSLFRKLK